VAVVYSFDPASVSLVVGGVLLSGFADDAHITVQRDEDGYTKKVGISGEVARLKNLNRSGRITVRLMASSSSNDELSLLAALDEAQGVGAVPVLCRDRSGRSVFATSFAWVKKYPAAGWTKDVPTWEWTLDTAALFLFVGGTNA